MTANRIKTLRELRGWSQEELGRRLGSNKFKISRLEAGEQKLDLDLALRIASEFEVSLSEVVALGPAAGLREDAKCYSPGPNDPLARLADPARKQALYIVKSRALDELGLVPGDVLLVDGSREAIEKPPALSAVVCEAIDDAGQKIAGATMLRQFVPPNLLVTNSHTSNASPINVTTANVRVVGVVTSRHHAIGPAFRG
jgi:transcriptional regulator with XRE-family HTH domain